VNRRVVASRVLLTLAAAIFLLGAVLHANAFFLKASHVIDGSSLKSFFAGELKVLWLADSTTLAGLGLFCGLIAAKPAWVKRTIILALSWIPAATSALLYFFLGPFYAAHMLMAATIMVVLSALILPASGAATREDTSAFTKSASLT